MTTIKISNQVLSREIDGETVLLDLASESFFGLDEVSTRVWQLLREGQGKAALIETLLGEYDVTRDVLVQDVDELLARLKDEGLIELG
jgi:hypothetical protein